MSKKSKLNGSVNMLAEALKGVVSEAIEENNDVILTEMSAMEKRLDERIDTTNKNTQSQIAQLRADVLGDTRESPRA